MHLFHYYEKERGPFQNLSDLPIKEAKRILDHIKLTNSVLAAQRFEGYMEQRRELEALVRRLFLLKGGKPVREVPHYMVVEECDWIRTWYKDGASISIPLERFDTNTLSFTYGDMFPTFSPKVTDGKEYRRKVYTYDEILLLIKRYGLPQHWNPTGSLGPERYIEVQVWSDETINEAVAKR